MPAPSRSDQLAARCAQLAANKKAADIVILDLRSLSSFTDFFVICSAASDPQLKAVAGEIQEGVQRETGRKPSARDGQPTSQWIVLDYGDVVVHLFHESKRHFYRLEDLWGDAPRTLYIEPDASAEMNRPPEATSVPHGNRWSHGPDDDDAE